MVMCTGEKESVKAENVNSVFEAKSDGLQIQKRMCQWKDGLVYRLRVL